MSSKSVRASSFLPASGKTKGLDIVVTKITFGVERAWKHNSGLLLL